MAADIELVGGKIRSVTESRTREKYLNKTDLLLALLKSQNESAHPVAKDTLRLLVQQIESV